MFILNLYLDTKSNKLHSRNFSIPFILANFVVPVCFTINISYLFCNCHDNQCKIIETLVHVITRL